MVLRVDEVAGLPAGPGPGTIEHAEAAADDPVRILSPSGPRRRTADPTRSTSQDLAELLPGARVVRAFNTIGFENLATARDRIVPAAMFVAGDDPEAKAIVLGLAAELGFRPEDAGPLANAKALEEMVKVWLVLSRQHDRTIGFAISDG